MKTILLGASLFIGLQSGISQSLFFDQLEESFWTSPVSEPYDLSSTLNSLAFSLAKFTSVRNQLTQDYLIFIFQDSLEVRFYDFSEGESSFVDRLEYKEKNGQLMIRSADSAFLYDVGIVSTGNFVLLTKVEDD